METGYKGISGQDPVNPVKLLSLKQFVGMFGLPLIRKAREGEGAEHQARWQAARKDLKAFGEAYGTHLISGQEEAGFPAKQSLEDWMASFQAWESLVAVAKDLEKVGIDIGVKAPE
jgi:hypothetical protein